MALRGMLGVLVAGAFVACATGGPIFVSEDDTTDGGRDASLDGSADGTPNGADTGANDTGAPDAGCVKPPGATVCGVAPQCGCGSNQTCDVTSSTGKTACINAGTGQMGTPCTSTASCAVGLTCSVGGTCHAFCDTAGKDCGIPGTGRCFQVKDSSQKDVPNLKVCLIQCKLDDPSSCGGTAGCVSDGTTTDCGKAGTSRTTCPAVGDCAPGYTCASSGTGTGTCYKWCKGVGTLSTCSGLSTQCRAFNPAVVVDGVEYGGCY